MSEQIESPNERWLQSWDQLGFGAPTIIALAHLCSQAMIRQAHHSESLGLEAKTILHTARHRGVFEIRCNNDAYESPARFLTVCVELDAEQRIRFGNNRDPQLNIRYLDGFRQLCVSGLVMHQLYHEFSLTRRGFDVAHSIRPDEVEPWPGLEPS